MFLTLILIKLDPSLEDTYSEKPQGGGGHQIEPVPQMLKS